MAILENNYKRRQNKDQLNLGVAWSQTNQKNGIVKNVNLIFDIENAQKLFTGK